MEDFIEKLKTRLSQPLPGPAAQNQMKARRSGGQSISFTHKGPPKKGAVALLLYPERGSWFFPLMKRRIYPGIHSGQISLPGGKMESVDDSLTDTAIRESREELGLKVARKQVIGSLTELYIAASHFHILPVIAVLDSKPELTLDPREVDQVQMVSTDQLLNPDVVKEKDIVVRGYDIRAPHFEVENQVVWGATAMILSEFLAVVREIN